MKYSSDYKADYKKPQMNADERRYIIAMGFADFFAGRGFSVTECGRITHRKVRKERKAAEQKSSRSGMENRYSINNELVRTDTNLSHPEFVRVRISSLLMSILLIPLRPLRSGMKNFSSLSMNHSSWLTLRLNVFSAPAHERAPPAPAVHTRLSGAGGLEWKVDYMNKKITYKVGAV